MMKWQNCDISFEDSSQEPKFEFSVHKNCEDDSFFQKESLQLQKFQDPRVDTQRQHINTILSHFGKFLVTANFHDISKNLLTEDSEHFFFNTSTKASIRYSKCPEAFIDIFKGIIIIERKVRETHMDPRKDAACQTSNVRILFHEIEEIIDGVLCELFTFKGSRIYKYRAFFGSLTPAHGIADLFGPTKKDRMLAKIKELNYAWAREPDLEIIAFLMHENTEYRLWSWDRNKCFTFNKRNFVSTFFNIEEVLKIKSVVPFDIATDRELVVGTYVYHLKEKSFSCGSGKKFIWFSTCVYSFDEDANILKVNQQGELFLEEEAPWDSLEVNNESKIGERVNLFFGNLRSNMDMFCGEYVNSSCSVCTFTYQTFLKPGIFHGIQNCNNITIQSSPDMKLEMDWVKPVDMFIDHHDPSYEVAVAFVCSQGVIDIEGYESKGKLINGIGIVKMAFENGKLAKLMQFVCELIEPIPSPFDDTSFYCHYVKQ